MLSTTRDRKSPTQNVVGVRTGRKLLVQSAMATPDASSRLTADVTPSYHSDARSAPPSETGRVVSSMDVSRFHVTSSSAVWEVMSKSSMTWRAMVGAEAPRNSGALMMGCTLSVGAMAPSFRRTCASTECIQVSAE